MAHFAKIENDIVTQVIVIDDSHESNGQVWINVVLGLEGQWLQTSYNGNIRGNYAGVGYTYDRENDVFYAQQPFPSWVLNSEWQWKAPVPFPYDGEFNWTWSEEEINWIKIS